MRIRLPSKSEDQRKRSQTVQEVNQVFSKATAFYYALVCILPRRQHSLSVRRDELKELTGIANESENRRLITKILGVLSRAKWIKVKRKRRKISKEGEPNRYVTHMKIFFLIGDKRPRSVGVPKGRRARLKQILRQILYSAAYQCLDSDGREHYKIAAVKLIRAIAGVKMAMPQYGYDIHGPTLSWDEYPDSRALFWNDRTEATRRLMIQRRTNSGWKNLYALMDVAFDIRDPEAFKLGLTEALSATERGSKDLGPFSPWKDSWDADFYGKEPVVAPAAKPAAVKPPVARPAPKPATPAPVIPPPAAVQSAPVAPPPPKEIEEEL
jgi:hypothetical protein